ncbi:MAG: sulfate adenylyltransferase subunit CysD [Albidovulum sp.]|nr:sulfate adenylyltransferase subunit CysD [Albidovulum sp.]
MRSRITSKESGIARLSHLDILESESINIIRETFAEFANPVMLYSVGKDSSVMLELAKKAFAPGRLPFPLLHIDTGWKFKETIRFRDDTAERYDLDLIVHTNQEGVARGIGPISHGTRVYTDVMKTEALRQALEMNGFNAAIGGARRDEAISRAKERIFSFRNRHHRWDPKNQRPEPWNFCNSRLGADESVRVFPLSNWTELDIWLYIFREGIPVVPLYFADRRPVVQRNSALIVLDDDRMPLKPNEEPAEMLVRFRTIGCWPLTGAVESSSATVPEIIREIFANRVSERAGRLIDRNSKHSLEQIKHEGYF